ncbi:thermonuclease family protein [Sphingobacterium oryzagri]|uniref:Thermonuclease family protein n=1 Tax=Sphingobacterium oryzagri TaxID=3025669 RepID=A0ABY7WGM9_9SPHI|nr:thermonuclease family protein [Sphingobacterium sp. KACC 22765]WDF67677.1 thermonuclease family protein [Sphingobacterium sp. KACC 22765]
MQAEKQAAAIQLENGLLNANHYKVYKVVDGDTFWVKNRKQQQIKVRLIGIDAPETRNAFYKKKHPLGDFCKDYLTKLLADQTVRLAFDVDSLDRYGRTLAYAYLDDGLFINEEMIRKGYAIVMTVSPNVQFAEQFHRSQVKAREEKLGLWQRYSTEDELKF